MEPTIFQYIGTTVENAVAAFLLPAIAGVIDAIQGIALIGTTIYIWILGVSILFGQGNVRELFGKGFKVVIVTALALSVDNYSAFFIDTFAALEAGLAEALSVGTAGGSIYSTLDSALGDGMELVNLAFRMADEAGWNFGSAFAWIITGLIVAIGTIIVGLLGGATIIMAKFAVAILFAVGPFFVLLLLWPVTARYFDGWFGSAVNYTLLVVVVATVMSFAVVAFGAFVSAADLSGAGEANPLLVAAEVFVLCFVLAFLVTQSISLAAGLSGGLTSAALTLRQVAAPGMATQRAARVINPISTRRDLQSGMLARSSRAGHLIAGNTIANPAYRQHLVQQFGRNWSRKAGGRLEKQR